MRLLNFSLAVCTIVAILFSGAHASAKNPFKGLLSSSKESKEPKKADNLPEQLYEMTLDENLNALKTGKQADKIRDYQKKQALAFKKKGYKTEVMRNGEIVIISIPATDLFVASDSAMIRLADQRLSPFVKLMESPDFYRTILVMNSDNTGSDNYKLSLTKVRVQAVMNWFDAHGANTDYVVPYAVGDKNPITDNNSISHRALNRRLEVYLVPGTAMIDAAKKNNLRL